MPINQVQFNQISIANDPNPMMRKSISFAVKYCFTFTLLGIKPKGNFFSEGTCCINVSLY